MRFRIFAASGLRRLFHLSLLYLTCPLLLSLKRAHFTAQFAVNQALAAKAIICWLEILMNYAKKDPRPHQGPQKRRMVFGLRG